MRALAGAQPAHRGPTALPILLLGGLALLSISVLVGTGALEVAMLVVVMATCAVAYQSVLSWRVLLAGLILIILFIPIGRYTLPSALPFNLEPYRIFVALVLGAWLVSLLVDSRVRLARSVFDRQIGLIVGAVLISEVLNPGRVNSVGSFVPKSLSFFLSYILVYYFIVSVVRDWRTIDLLLKVLVGGTAVIAVFALIERRTNYNVFDHLHSIAPFLTFSGSLGGAAIERGGRLRVYGSAQHPIAFGALFVIVLPLAVYLARRTGNRRWWLAFLLIGVGAFSTVSRTAVVMLAVVALVFLWLRPRETKRLWPILIPVLAAVHIAMPGTMGTLWESFFPRGGLVAEQSSIVPGHELTSNGRLSDLGPSSHEFLRRPFFGEGYGTRVTGFDEKFNNAPILDDQWLKTLLEIGIVGFVGFLWIFCRCVRRMSRSAREDDSERSWLYVGLAASIAAFGTGMATFDAFSFTQVTFVFFILLALASVLLSRDELRVAPPVEDR